MQKLNARAIVIDLLPCGPNKNDDIFKIAVAIKETAWHISFNKRFQ